MTDNDLYRLIIPILNTGLQDYGYAGVRIRQAYQPTQQGVATAPTVYLFKVSDHRYGFLGRSDAWDGAQMIHTEDQQYESTFQLSALVIQNPANPQYTASDLVNDCAGIMQSDKSRVTLETQNVAILRVMEVRNPYFTDDRDNFEASPSFDFILTYHRTRVSVGQEVQQIDTGIYRV